MTLEFPFRPYMPELIKNVKLNAKTFNINEDVIWAIIYCESSGGDTYAARYEPGFKYLSRVDVHAKACGISKNTELILQSTSFGVMQVMGGTARDLGLRDNILTLTRPEVGILFGCLYLNSRYEVYGKKAEGIRGFEPDVIASYNAGSPRKGSDGKYLEKVQEYVDKVYRAFTSLAIP